MRLKTKLVLAATVVTLLVVLVLSSLFLAELLRQRITQTTAANEVLADEVRAATRRALESGLVRRPSTAPSEAALFKSVADLLRHDSDLKATMDSIVRYALTVQDVSVTDARGFTIASTDPDVLGQVAPGRIGLRQVETGSLYYQWRQVFGPPHVLDIPATLDRNGQPFLVVHVGLRSTFLKASFTPEFRDALIVAILATLVLVMAAGFFANVALRPLEVINEQLELLTAGAEDDASAAPDLPGTRPDTVIRVAKTIDRLQRKMRSKETSYTALQANMEQMLDTLRDGVMLFATDRASGELRSVMVSDAVAHFLPDATAIPASDVSAEMIGRRLDEIFPADSALGKTVLAALGHYSLDNEKIQLEDGRQVQVSLDRIDDGRGIGVDIGTLLTLRDTESVLQLEQELEVSRRLAAIGRITAGVGHEVKNPINAMVLHLELLRGKLTNENGSANGAQRHLDILSSEMQRLDRVVQTLADFSRPMELRLRLVDLRDIVASVIELTWEQMQELNVNVVAEATRESLMVHVDTDLIRQALLNLVLNGMQAMEDGGVVKIVVRREHHLAIIEVQDKGTGIQADLLPRIFELYFTTKKTGSGIGLATTYRILQMHGGALDVRSTADEASPERGSVFAIRLPLSVLTPNLRGDTNNPALGKERGARA